MYNSILHFIENDIKKIENLLAAMLKGEKEPHDLSQHIHDRMLTSSGRKQTGERKVAMHTNCELFYTDT